MKKLLIILLLVGPITRAKAQTTDTANTEHNSAVKAKDADVKRNVIDPAVKSAGRVAPDWMAITKAITQKYDGVTADRTVTKAKIFFYYFKDWPAFWESIVHYTNNYELADDYPLLSKNAEMVLKNTNASADLKDAQKWSKLALNSDPNNTAYKNTYDALTPKP